MSADYGMDDLLYLMARLRDPEQGCPWDLEQDFHSLIPHTVEETCELVDAIENGDFANLCEELGDLLLQVMFYARLAEESGHFCFADVTAGLAKKLLRRHPHVFPDGTPDSRAGTAAQMDSEQVSQRWEQIKAAERDHKNTESSSHMDGLPRSLSALSLAAGIQRRAARIGFDWKDVRGPLRKLHEELAELEDEDADTEAELGDLLFACVNVARHLGLDAEGTLRSANRRFVRRFRFMEEALAEGGEEGTAMDGQALEDLWLRAKQREQKQCR